MRVEAAAGGSRGGAVARAFRRDKKRAVLGGVAAGLGEYFDVDPVLVRLGLVFLALLNGLGVLFYVVCWILVPAHEEGTTQTAAAQNVVDNVRETGERVVGELRQVSERAGGARVLLGGFLILLGCVLLAEELHWLHWPHWARFDTLWPLVIVAAGVSLMTRATRGAHG